MSNVTEQQAPIPNDRPAVWDLVIGDMRARDEIGRARYSTPLQPFNGRVEELLVDVDESVAAVYIRQVIYERDGR